MISALIQDEDETPEVTEDNEYEFDEEQHEVAKLIMLIHNEDTDTHFETLKRARTYLGKGGDLRLKYTFPPLMFNCFRLISRVYAREQDEEEIRFPLKKVFKFIYNMQTAYAAHEAARGLRIYCTAALAADRCGHDNIAYEFLARALTVYEEDISPREQYDSICLVTATVTQLQSLDTENLDTLNKKCSQYSFRLLQKEHQARAIYHCAHLYWTDKTRSGKQVMKVLTKALKITQNIVNTVDKITIFIEILNKDLYFISKDCEKITTEHVNTLIALIKELTDNLEEEEDGGQEIIRHFTTTLKYISDQKKGENGEKFAEIEIGS